MGDFSLPFLGDFCLTVTLSRTFKGGFQIEKDKEFLS
jgi:hypothetical protein